MRTLVIGVNYDSDAMTLRFVRGLAKLRHDQDCTIIVVDNSKNANTELAQAIQDSSPSAMYLKPLQNLGYLRGASYGLNEFVKSDGTMPDWVIVANVDIEFKNEGFLARLAEANYGEEVGVVSPAIWSNNLLRAPNRGLVSKPNKHRMRVLKLACRNHYTFRAYYALAGIKNAVTYAWRYRLRASAGGRSASSRQVQTVAPETQNAHQQRQPKAIYAPHGSCIILSRSFFTRGGSLDYPMFLFGEEMYIAETARSLGLQVVYDPMLEVWHDDHTSTGLMPTRRMASYMRESTAFIIDQYFDRIPDQQGRIKN